MPINDHLIVDWCTVRSSRRCCRNLILVSLGLLIAVLVSFQEVNGQVTEPVSYLKKLPGIIIADLSALPTDATLPEGRSAFLLGLTTAIVGPLFVDEEVRSSIQPATEVTRKYLIRPFMLNRMDLAIGLHAGAFGLLGMGWITGKEGLTRWGGAFTDNSAGCNSVPCEGDHRKKSSWQWIGPRLFNAGLHLRCLSLRSYCLQLRIGELVVPLSSACLVKNTLLGRGFRRCSPTNIF